VAANEQMFGEE